MKLASPSTRNNNLDGVRISASQGALFRDKRAIRPGTASAGRIDLKQRIKGNMNAFQSQEKLRYADRIRPSIESYTKGGNPSQNAFGTNTDFIPA